VTAIPAESRTTAGFLRFWAAARPDHPALRWGEGSQLTYGELDERSSRVARALAASGVRPGERVAFLDKNSPEQVEIFFGAAKLGAVPCPVNFRLAPPEVATVVADSEAPIFFVGQEFAAGVDKVSDQLPGVAVVVIGGAERHGEAGAAGRAEYASWRDGQPAEDPGHSAEPADVAYQLYSSGTTGRPKGVQLTQANLCAGVGLYPAVMGLGSDSVSLVAMPLYHIGGGGWALAGFAQGATNVLVRDLVPTALVDLIVAERISHAFLVPAVLQFMLAVPGVADRDFSALRAILYGASPISETVLAASIRTFGCSFVQAYGLTETTGTVVYLPADDHDPDGPRRHRLRAAGVPTPGTEVRIVDPAAGCDVAAGEVGEIWVKGPTVMKGYAKMPDQTAETIVEGGWLRTGDAGYRDADGYVYIHDRVKDMIVSGGENIYPAEVENAIMSHPEVSDVAVVGVPDDRWGETPKAFVVKVTGSQLAAPDLLAWCRERLAGFKCPTSVEWVDELPRNPSGKVLKKDLRAPYWEGRSRMVG
jgi:long-chain acyl-CoA synthetase